MQVAVVYSREWCRVLRVPSLRMSSYVVLITARTICVIQVWKQRPGCLGRADEAIRPMTSRDRNQMAGYALAARRGTRNLLSLWESATHSLFPVSTSQPCFHCSEETIGNGETSISAAALLLPPTPPSWMKPDCGGRSAKARSSGSKAQFASKLGGEANERLA